jgi:transposase-like protein
MKDERKERGIIYLAQPEIGVMVALNPIAENASAVLTIVERDGRVHSTHVSTVTQDNLLAVMRSWTTARSRIMTDESPTYTVAVEQSFASHETVNHKEGEYVRGEAYTNTAESFHSMLKRGVHGIYHH